MSRITLSERVAIEAGLYGRQSLKEIAEKIHKSPRHVSAELKRNSTKIKVILIWPAQNAGLFCCRPGLHVL